MISKPLQKHLIASFVLILGFTGCTEVTYQRLSDPSRDTWQKPQGVIEELSIAPGSRVADLGAGGGYFTWHLAKAVGARGTPNVRPVHATLSDPRFPEPVDLVFNCNTYHQMTERIAYFRSLASSLRPDGRVAIIDSRPRGLVFDLFDKRVAKKEVRLEMEAAGYRLVNDFDLLDRQHFQIFAVPSHGELHSPDIKDTAPKDPA